MIKVNKLSLTYGNEKVLKDISITINAGECILFTGKSGSGKSSIINSLNGLSAGYDGAKLDGEIFIGGKSTRDLELYEISMLIATVFQNPKTYFFNVNTTMELLFFLENIGLKREEMDKRLKKMLHLFPISHLLNRDIFKLSGGEKQILCIAASYLSGTGIVVLDEPSSNLDEKNIEIVKGMLQKLKREGITILIAEHRIYYLMDVVDRIFFVEKGRLKKEFSKKDFLKLEIDDLHALGLRDKDKTKLRVATDDEKGDFFIQSLRCDFDGPGNQLTVANASFQIGKIYGIVGSNGRGKSTLLRCLIGVEKKSKEEIYFQGTKVSKKERLKMSSLVMQDVNHQLFTDSVKKELALGIKNPDVQKEEALLRDLDLSDRKDRHPMSLSGGQKQRVAIASVLCKNSKLIYFDEPTSGMDYTNMMQISKRIRACKSADNIIFIVSHDIEFLNEVADFIFEL